MAVFRVERNRGYTVMSNHHLRNKELSLKAKGLLSQMLSLPEDWDYTLAGLSLINKESIDAIRTAIWELEKAGYITRRQGRDERGKMTAIEYTIYEQPQPPQLDSPILENPTSAKPSLDFPTTAKPTTENPTQLNKDISRTDLPKKDQSITDLSSTDSIPILSPDPSPCGDAAAKLRKARLQVAKAMGAEPTRVFFTAGGTEADNWAIFSAMERMGKRGKHIITTAIEHHAVLHPMKRLEAMGYRVTYLQPDTLGRISVEVLEGALEKDTVLVSMMLVNNETGAVMPIREMAKVVHRKCPEAIFHTDAVQGFLKIPFQAKTLGADLISVSSHKVHGPKGVGALYISPRLKSFPAFLLGGGQESGLRSGTEAMPAICGLRSRPCRVEG